MADIIDKGNDRAEEILEDALKNRKREHLPPKGRCYNCDEKLADGLRFCDSDCRDDWEFINRVRKGQFKDSVIREVRDDEP